jgi:hypothetical protein
MPKSKNPEFQISSLRQDQLVLAAQAIAVNITCLVISSLFGLVVNLGLFSEMYLFYANIAIFVLGVAYTIYVLITNFSRLKQIKSLEAKL